MLAPWALEMKGLTIAQKMVLIVYVWRCDSQARVSMPMGEVAELASVSRSTATRATWVLEEKGLLEVEARRSSREGSLPHRIRLTP